MDISISGKLYFSWLKKYWYIILILLLFSSVVQAKHLNPESYYQELDCKGTLEYTLDDKTRVDCLNETEAIEYDFCPKWYECLSQALYYAMKTGKRATMILIQEKETDIKYIERAKKTVDFYQLPVTVRVLK